MTDIDVNEIFGKIVSSAKDVAGYVSGKAVQGFDLGKAEYEILMQEKELGNLYKSLGKVMYQIEIGELSRDDSVVAAACNQITEAIAHIKALKDSQTEIKTREITLKKKADPAAETEEAAAPEDGCLMMKFCPECGVGNAPDADKCTNCGHEF